MAAEQEQQPQKPGTSNQLTAGLNRDLSELALKPGQYTHARNATNVLPNGQTGMGLHTECANLAETVIPYTLIGRIQLYADIWWLYSTNDILSEIGEYNESTGSYITKLNDAATIAAGFPGMGFSTLHLITGDARRNFDCGFNVYWADGFNPDRMVDTQYLYPNPWIQNCTTLASCVTCVNTAFIDIEQLRLSPQYTIPCLTLAKSTGSGTLANGSYQVCVRFAINTIPCTDFIALSNEQAIWAHGNSAGAVVLTISGISNETTVIFPELEVVVVSMQNFQIQAKRLGIYSSTTQTIYIDNLDQELINIDLKLLPISNPIIDKSDAIYSISNYLTRVGVYEKPDFNYQPLANQIIAYWTAHAYPDDYYHKGGLNGFPMNVSSMPGERYNYYIRWRYTTGDVSASYTIPGLPVGSGATLIPGGIAVGDGSIPIAYGRFSGYSSTEIYPNNQPTVWGTLCGLPIQLHEFPDQSTFGGTILSHFNPNGITINGNNTIRVFGMRLDNIQSPVDINGVLIPNIQGYEILRSVRNGHEHVVACGMVNNMRTFTDSAGQQGLFQNYPYNDLAPDPFLSNNVATINAGAVGNGLVPNAMLTGYRNDILSFHSPETVFQQPYLGAGELTLLMGMKGFSHGQFEVPYKHPLFKVLTNFDTALGNILGTFEAAFAVINVINSVLGANPPDMKIAPTQAIPFSFPLFAPQVNPEDYLIDGTSIGTAINIAIGIANAAVLLLLEPIQIVTIREQFLTIIKGLIPGRQYAAQYNSSGFYDTPVDTGNVSIPILDYSYIKGQIQYFAGLSINNLYRNNYIALQLGNSISPLLGDNSRYLLTDVGNSFNWDSSHTIESYYASYRIPQGAQYGQVDSTKQVPISCMQIAIPGTASVFSSPVLFGGDTYINRYTEKNPFFFFNDWLINVPEDFTYDYRNYINVPYPMFWINNDVINYTLLGLASVNRRLNGALNTFSSFLPGLSGNAFYVNTGFFYLFNNGVRDFYVESTVNVGYRDYEDVIEKQFYNPYGPTQDINQIFRSDIIKSDIYYKYDYSLSADKFFNQYLSWGKCLDRDYNPVLAYTCYNYYPRRLVYSLPQEEELKKDNWKVFLPNNYKDFPTNIVSVKAINRTGAMFVLDDQSPMMLQGTEFIPSKNGVDYTVGTGELFAQTLQQVANVDNGYQYGSCQNRLSVLSTTYGIFWVSRNTGKVFQYAPGKAYYNQGETMIDIAAHGLKYDLSLFMPSQLLKQFPDYPLYDNPVAGIGVQLIYDDINELLYICKKDYQALPGVQLVGSQFYAGPTTVPIPVTLGDPLYFTDCSFTLSYSPRDKQWISYHDWIPALNIPAKTHFLTTDTSIGTGNILYRHNLVTNLFCNYYGIDRYFEIEYVAGTGLTETVLQNIECIVESQLYRSNQVDTFLEYNGFFDIAMIRNKEQNSGILELNLRPWDNPYLSLTYPFQDAFGTQILYDRVENTWRFNTYYDLTADRGQFGLGNVNMINTDPNGFTFTLNNTYINAAKPVFERKRIRGRWVRVFLRKNIVSNTSLSFFFGKSNVQNSSR